MSEKRKVLGRGLAALLPGAASPPGGPAVRSETGVRPSGEGLRTVAIEEVHPAATQPRKTFDDVRLSELAESIRTQGIIQPLVVRLRGRLDPLLRNVMGEITEDGQAGPPRQVRQPSRASRFFIVNVE